MAGRRALIRLILLGDANVGKTSLLARYVNGKFLPGYRATLGADFFTREVVVNDRMVTLQLWDTAGMERCQRVLGAAFFRGADGVCLCFDLTNPASFESLGEWRDQFAQHARVGNAGDFPMVVLGTKADLRDERKVPREAIDRWCKLNGGLPFFEVSAKDDLNVSEAFRSTCRAAMQAGDREPTPLPDIPIITLKKEESSWRGPCEC